MLSRDQEILIQTISSSGIIIFNIKKDVQLIRTIYFSIVYKTYNINT
jgi:hypothetical protein